MAQKSKRKSTKSLPANSAIVEKKFSDTKSVKPFKTVIKKHYILHTSKAKGRMLLRLVYQIISNEDLDKDGKMIRSRSESHTLEATEAKALAKKLGWSYRQPSLHYMFRVDNKLKFMAGSVLRNHQTIRNLDYKAFKKLRD